MTAIKTELRTCACTSRDINYIPLYKLCDVAVFSQWSLHCAWVIDDLKCILVTCICVSVCLPAATCPHYCMDLDVTWGMVGGAPSCALLDRFAIGARVSCGNAKCQRVLVLGLCLVHVCSQTWLLITEYNDANKWLSADHMLYCVAVLS